MPYGDIPVPLARGEMKSAHWSATPPNQEQGIAYVHLSCEIRSEEFAPHILPDTASKTVDALLRAS